MTDFFARQQQKKLPCAASVLTAAVPFVICTRFSILSDTRFGVSDALGVFIFKQYT